MTVRKFSDQGFDDYRKERKRMQAKLGPQAPALNYENQALRELELAEAREARDQKLTREVHDFFAAATRQAASIVEKVAKDALQATGAQVDEEMEQFLIDALTRMNTFIVTVLRERRGPVAETQLEPSLENIVGASLDQFRWAGTADVDDKHIGQDPFETPVDEVQREFREQVGQTPAGEQPASIDEHRVAAMQSEEDGEAPAVDEQASELPPAVAPTTRTSAAATVRAAVAVATPAAAPAPTPNAPLSDIDRFKEALKSLVKQGMMSREEARAAWLARVEALKAKG